MSRLGHIAETESTKAWDSYDIVAVSCILLFANVIFAILLIVIGSGLSDKSQLTAAMYFGALSSLILTKAWVTKRYGLGPRSLGLRQGSWGREKIIWFGLAFGLIYFFLAGLLSGSLSSLPVLSKREVIIIMTAPISINGFPVIVLGPIGEEIYCRGFLYAWLQKRWGEALGLVVQAAVFSILHVAQVQIQHMNATILLPYLLSAFGLGLVLGVLYRVSSSLYPCIITHGVYNFLAVINAYLGTLHEP
jgi:uncharacterized protein